MKVKWLPRVIGIAAITINDLLFMTVKVFMSFLAVVFYTVCLVIDR